MLDNLDTVDVIALNSSLKESSIVFQDPQHYLSAHEEWEIINAEKKEIESTISASINGISYWKQCLLLSLLFLFIEILILRLWKSN